ncbi:hypothetical protein [Aestuariivirga litoralis]|uniref:hypothetical protein n=1 Tax=Aestuariivirga litoralis TaxID=2650924 RepID=UPI0018C7599C|nr:hypothetical protein [Aestuariivirga litoralis]MBG1230791.1 hypothetical protein [Aestuariivirga litoralis]
MQRRLLSGLNAADSIVFKKDKLWWLLTSVKAGQWQRSLALYSMADFLKSEPVPHPVNANTLYADAKAGTGRNAGGIWQAADGALLRLLQSTTRHYGEASTWHRIQTLDKAKFAEVPDDGPATLKAHPEILAGHHYSVSGKILAFDRRTRLPWQPRLAEFLRRLSGRPAPDAS